MNILAGNWKMNKTRTDVEAFFSELNTSEWSSSQRYIVAPSPALLECSLRCSEKSPVEIFAQNCSYKNEGAYTGECSPLQLKDLGVKGSLIAHSERRQLFGESLESSFERLNNTVAAGLDAIFCFGESLEEREKGLVNQILEEQLSGVWSCPEPQKVILAYEPVWAIGTGKTASAEQVAEVHKFVHDLMQKNQRNFPLLYGGSVKPNNFKELLSVPHVSGGLVGGASLKAESFSQLADCLTD